MEAYWWIEKNIPFEDAERSDWYWKLMIPVPHFVEKPEFEKVLKTSWEKGKVSEPLKCFLNQYMRKRQCRYYTLALTTMKRRVLERS